MQLNLSNKCALVTGASQGIGKEIAVQLANEGAKVLLISNDEVKLNNVTNEINNNNGVAKSICCDLRNKESLVRIAKEANTYFKKIDILVNNVGSIGRVGDFDSFTPDEWLNLFNLNVLSGVLLTKLLIPQMKTNNYGRIIFISSEKSTEPGAFLAPYAMTKAAIISIAKSLSNEFGKWGITVNCVSPGVILTPAWDVDAKKANLTRQEYASQFCQNVISKEHLGTPKDVAMLVCYLCSDYARWITGSNFRVDGGSIKSLHL